MEKVKKMLSLAFASLFRRNKGQNTVKEKRQRSHRSEERRVGKEC